MRKGLVIDCSVTVAWALTDESSSFVEQILLEVIQHSAKVPAIWLYEVANALHHAQLKKRIYAEATKEFKQQLMQLPLTVDDVGFQAVFQDCAVLSEKHKLTIYDAAYLELAKREKLALASLDKDLIKAAKKEKIFCYE